MSAKLTLLIDEKIVEKAKSFAREQHTSLSKLVERYFQSLSADESGFLNLSPKTRSLMGTFSDDGAELTYKELVEKYKSHP
ncbi:MAG: hypothetical protein JXX29_00395 [Deltaproteobacteria bacterium]|nr:hypothetical protein [Deltaproteobacteria bacterium]MBN2670095.1 hypothetical protein [Deltaproteobacteria bacterium]